MLQPSRVDTITPFHIPQSIEAVPASLVEVAVRIVRRKPARAQITEVRIALEAAHVVATHDFLTGHTACRAGGCVEAHVFFCRFFFFCRLCLGTWQTTNYIPMPTLLTYSTEGIVAVFTNCKTIDSEV